MGKSGKILIVEDEIQLQSLLSDYLSDNGFDVIKAYNGKEGLDNALKVHPNLILLDIVMPIMDGIEMLKKLRKDEWGKHAKVMLLTNLDDKDTIEKAKKHDVHVYFLKAEWSSTQILEKVREMAMAMI